MKKLENSFMDYLCIVPFTVCESISPCWTQLSRRVSQMMVQNVEARVVKEEMRKSGMGFVPAKRLEPPFQRRRKSLFCDFPLPCLPQFATKVEWAWLICSAKSAASNELCTQGLCKNNKRKQKETPVNPMVAL